LIYTTAFTEDSAAAVRSTSALGAATEGAGIVLGASAMSAGGVWVRITVAVTALLAKINAAKPSHLVVCFIILFLLFVNIAFYLFSSIVLQI
jgi:hypothetical protein